MLLHTFLLNGSLHGSIRDKDPTWVSFFFENPFYGHQVSIGGSESDQSKILDP